MDKLVYKSHGSLGYRPDQSETELIGNVEIRTSRNSRLIQGQTAQAGDETGQTLSQKTPDPGSLC